MRPFVLMPLVFGCAVVHVNADTALPIGDEPVEPVAPADSATPSEPPRFLVCLDPSAAATSPLPDFAAEVAPLFDACVSCHRSSPTGLEFDDPHAELVGVPSTQLPTMSRIEPGNPRGSYLWHKLCGTQDEIGGSGDAMPIQGELTEAEAVTLTAWIIGGAPE